MDDRAPHREARLVTTERLWHRALALCLVAGTAACTAAVPAPSAHTTSVAESGSPAPSSASRSPRPTAIPASATPGPSGPEGALGKTLDIGTIDPAQAPYLTAFASDGASIWFGSGIADARPGTYAPDLWRYVPGADAPELVWSNPGRQRSISVIAADLGTVAFAEMDGDGKRDWKLWLLPDPGAQPFLLDSHPGDEGVSALLPSVSVSEGRVAWTAFDRGSGGPVSQLLVASAPDWTPVLLEERDAAVGELWLPSLRGTEIVYCELTYNPERTRDERHVYLTDTVARSERRQLDTSGRATMPLLVDGGVIWKETDPGFNMFNWGHLVYWDRATERQLSMASGMQPDVNYPSAGTRFVAIYGYDTALLPVYDLGDDRWRLIERYDVAAGEGVYRAHVAGDLMVWLETNAEVGGSGELRWAYLPLAGNKQLGS
jgi:hypothetical protein